MQHVPKDFAVFFDGSEVGLGILDIAARLAAGQKARLTGITSFGAKDVGAHRATGHARGAGIGDVIHHNDAENQAALARAKGLLDEAAARQGIECELKVAPHVGTDAEIALYSLYSDLLVVAHPQAPGTPFAWSPVDALQRTGVPVLIVPSTWAGKAVGDRITVAWNASRQARRAVSDALPLLAAASAVDLVIVDAQRKAEWHGQEPGADMAAYLARRGVKVTLSCIESGDKPAAQAIVAHAVGARSDMVVFGAYSRPRLSEAILGGVTRTLLGEVPLPLFMSA